MKHINILKNTLTITPRIIMKNTLKNIQNTLKSLINHIITPPLPLNNGNAGRIARRFNAPFPLLALSLLFIIPFTQSAYAGTPTIVGTIPDFSLTIAVVPRR